MTNARTRYVLIGAGLITITAALIYSIRPRNMTDYGPPCAADDRNAAINVSQSDNALKAMALYLATAEEGSRVSQKDFGPALAIAMKVKLFSRLHKKETATAFCRAATAWNGRTKIAALPSGFEGIANQYSAT